MHLRTLAISIATVMAFGTPVIAGPKGPAPKSPTTTTHGSPQTTSSHGSAHKGSTSTSSTSTTGTSTTTGSTTTPSGSTTSGSTTTLNPIAQKIASKPQLSSKISTMLPAGMSLNQASKGFKNQGQFVAALHVSQNLGIPFADLKTAMTGIRPTTTTGTKTSGTTTTGTTTTNSPLLSLGQAIKKLRPTANADAAATTATQQASADLGSR